MFATSDSLIEGQLAHEIENNQTRQQIKQRYNELHKHEPNPVTHPSQYDPLNPPNGWAYDPCYEMWIKTTK